MNEHDTDPQTAQYRYVEQQIGEVIVGNDCPVESYDEHLVPEMRNVAENFAEISESLHGVLPVVLCQRPFARTSLARGLTILARQLLNHCLRTMEHARKSRH